LIEYSLQFRTDPEFPEEFAAVPPYAHFLIPSKKLGFEKLAGISPTS
jgi:hypothetical protein